jgi:Concanavalin A-like lectin/glucanases superfamily/PEP-CTERM motif
MKNIFRLFYFSSLFLLLPSGLRAQDLSLGLVAQFNLDGNVLDSSGNGVVATLQNGTTWTTDRFGNPNAALDFGTGNVGVTGTGINLANSSSSISLWIEKNYVGNLYNGGWFLHVGSVGAAGQAMHLAIDYGQSIRYSFYYDDFDINTPVLAANTWYNLTFTFDNTTDLRSIYVDGNLVATDTAAYGFTGDSSFTFGQENINLSDISFYNRVLTPADVQALYNAPDPVPEPSSFALAGLGILGLIGIRKKLGKCYG